jgi:hypothetical protein
MLRSISVFPVLSLFLTGILGLPIQAAEEAQQKGTPPCGCGQPAGETPAERAGCVCRLFKTADFGTTCSYHAMYCPPTGSYSWGPYTCLCGDTAYSGCTNNNCPSVNCEPARKEAIECGVAPVVIEKGVDLGSDDWEPTKDEDDECHRLKKFVPPIFAKVTFDGGQELRVKLWRVQSTPKRPVPPVGKIPPEHEFCLGRQVGRHGHVDEQIPKENVKYLQAPGVKQTKAVCVTTKDNRKYLVLLNDAVPVDRL